MNKRKAYDVVGLWVLDPRDRDVGGSGAYRGNPVITKLKNTSAI